MCQLPSILCDTAVVTFFSIGISKDDNTPQSYLSINHLKLERQLSTGTCCADVGARDVTCNVGPFDSAVQQTAALQTVNDNPGFRAAARVMTQGNCMLSYHERRVKWVRYSMQKRFLVEDRLVASLLLQWSSAYQQT